MGIRYNTDEEAKSSAHMNSNLHTAYLKCWNKAAELREKLRTLGTADRSSTEINKDQRTYQWETDRDRRRDRERDRDRRHDRDRGRDRSRSRGRRAKSGR